MIKFKFDRKASDSFDIQIWLSDLEDGPYFYCHGPSTVLIKQSKEEFLDIMSRIYDGLKKEPPE